MNQVKSKITAKEIIELLREKHQHPWCFFEECKTGTGFKKEGRNRIDGWCINTFPSSQHLKIAYEIKISRSDFLLELKNPLKRKKALELSNKFYFISIIGVVKSIDEIPPECGYIEVTDDKQLKVIKEAPWRLAIEPTWLFCSALGRRVSKLESINFCQFSDSVLNSLFDSLSQMKGLKASEMLLYNYLEKEKFRRAYNKKTSENRAKYKFYAKTRKSNPAIQLEELQKLWVLKLKTKHRP